MGYNTHFYGKLEFTRKLTPEERATLDAIINGDRDAQERLLKMVMFGDAGDEISGALFKQAEAERAIDRGGKGPLIFYPHSGADLAASMRDLITGDGLSPHYAGDLRISNDETGLVYCSEKTYDMVAGVNFIIANARAKIPGFGLTGKLYADTEFEPYEWLVEINERGWAEQVPCDFGALPASERKIIADGQENWEAAQREISRRLDAERSPLRRVWNWGLAKFGL